MQFQTATEWVAHVSEAKRQDNLEALKGDSYRLRGKELDARPAARLPEIS